MLAAITSPYSHTGEAYETYRRHFGQKGDAKVLVAKAPSRVMNPSLSESVVARAYERDASATAAEYGAEFQSDLETFLPRQVIDAAVVPGRFEIPFITVQLILRLPTRAAAAAMR